MRAVHLHDNISFNFNSSVAIHVDPMITAEVTVYTYVYKNKNDDWAHDSMDCEIDWLLNGERVKYDGFHKLYTQLYGQERFDKLVKDVCTEAENLIAGRVGTSIVDIINDQIK